MSSSNHSRNIKLSSIFAIFIGLTLATWILRGFEVLTFIPSGIIWILILLSIILGILTYLQSNVW